MLAGLTFIEPKIFTAPAQNKFNKCEGISIRFFWWITTYSLADIKIPLRQLLPANTPRVLHMIINDPTKFLFVAHQK